MQINLDPKAGNWPHLHLHGAADQEITLFIASFYRNFYSLEKLFIYSIGIGLFICLSVCPAGHFISGGFRWSPRGALYYFFDWTKNYWRKLKCKTWQTLGLKNVRSDTRQKWQSQVIQFNVKIFFLPKLLRPCLGLAWNSNQTRTQKSISVRFISLIILGREMKNCNLSIVKTASWNKQNSSQKPQRKENKSTINDGDTRNQSIIHRI